MNRIGIITSVFLLMTITFLPSIVIAVAIAGTETINEGEYWHTEIPLLDRSEIYIRISVLNGIPVDIFLFDEENFGQYINQDSSYEFISEGSHLNTTSSYIVVTLESGKYFLVVDNTDEGLASPPQDAVNNFVTFRYNLDYPALHDMLCFFAGVIAIIIIVILIVVLIVRKIRRTTKYQQPYPQYIIYQQPVQQQTYHCLTCGKPLRYIYESKKWYCEACRKYV